MRKTERKIASSQARRVRKTYSFTLGPDEVEALSNLARARRQTKSTIVGYLLLEEWEREQRRSEK